MNRPLSRVRGNPREIKEKEKKRGRIFAPDREHPLILKRRFDQFDDTFTRSIRFVRLVMERYKETALDFGILLLSYYFLFSFVVPIMRTK